MVDDDPDAGQREREIAQRLAASLPAADHTTELQADNEDLNELVRDLTEKLQHVFEQIEAARGADPDHD
jgi:hypothetical protein